MARAVFRDAVPLDMCAGATGSPCPYPRAGCREGEGDEAPRVAEEYGGEVLWEGAPGDFLLISRSALDAVRPPSPPTPLFPSMLVLRTHPLP